MFVFVHAPKPNRYLIVSNNDVLFTSATTKATYELDKNTNKWSDRDNDSNNHNNVDGSWNAECMDKVVPVVAI